MRLVVDASVVLKWFLRGQPGEMLVTEAEAVLSVIGRSRTELFAPGHWIAEVVAVLARTKPGAVDDALIFLDDMRPVIVDGIPVVKRLRSCRSGSTTICSTRSTMLSHWRKPRRW